MRIAFIVGTFPKLSETFILSQVTGLMDRGQEVDIFAAAPSNEPVVHEDFKKYDLAGRTFHFCHGEGELIMPRNKKRRVLKAAVLFVKHFHKGPMCILRSLNIFKYGREAASLGLLYKAVRFLNKPRYDVIFCHFGANGIIGAMLKDVGAIDGKLMTAFHGADMSRSIRTKGDHIYDLLFRRGELFLPVSERWRDELIRLGCDSRKIAVHRMGIDIDKFNFIPRAKREGRGIDILTVGRLVEKKGIKYGIRAVARIVDRYPDVRYTIIGDGPMRDDIERLVSDLGLKKNVHVLGWRPQEEVVRFMNAADIFLAPSVTAEDGDQEGIPVVLMEAMAQGLPVISTKHSGIPELVQDGESGFLVDERDVEALAERLGFLIGNAEIRSELGLRGRRCVEEDYNIRGLNDRLVALYKGVLDNRKPEKADLGIICTR